MTGDGSLSSLGPLTGTPGLAALSVRTDVGLTDCVILHSLQVISFFNEPSLCQIIFKLFYFRMLDLNLILLKQLIFVILFCFCKSNV
jgi:hypothetical protein